MVTLHKTKIRDELFQRKEVTGNSEKRNFGVEKI